MEKCPKAFGIDIVPNGVNSIKVIMFDKQNTDLCEISLTVAKARELVSFLNDVISLTSN